MASKDTVNLQVFVSAAEHAIRVAVTGRARPLAQYHWDETMDLDLVFSEMEEDLEIWKTRYHCDVTYRYM